MLVMPTAGKNLQHIAGNAIDEAMLRIDAAAPEAAQIAPEGLRLAQALEGPALNIANEQINAAKHGPILGLPEKIIGPGLIEPDFFHSSSPSSSCASP